MRPKVMISADLDNTAEAEAYEACRMRRPAEGGRSRVGSPWCPRRAKDLPACGGGYSGELCANCAAQRSVDRACEARMMINRKRLSND